MRGEASPLLSRRFALAFAVICATSVAATAQAVRDGNCAARFHDALTKLSDTHLRELADARAALTAADGKLAGNWMFFKREDRLKARLAARLSDGPLTQGEMVCAQSTADRGGRVRCLKWVDKASAPARPIADVTAARDMPMAKAELALISQLTRIVRSRGLLEEFDRNGRFIFLVSRTSDEIGDYLRQPLRPGLCSGATEMMGFYDTSFAPMRKRVDEFRQLTETARSWVGREARRLESDEARAAGVVAEKSAPASTAAPDLRNPGEIMQAVARRHFGEAAASGIAAAPDLLTGLARFEDVLMTPEPPAATASATATVTAPPVAPTTVAATTSTNAPSVERAPKTEAPPSLVPLLRAIEAFAYADLAHGKVRRLDDAYTSLMRGVTDAHAKTCTCGE